MSTLLPPLLTFWSSRNVRTGGPWSVMVAQDPIMDTVTPAGLFAATTLKRVSYGKMLHCWEIYSPVAQLMHRGEQSPHADSNSGPNPLSGQTAGVLQSDTPVVAVNTHVDGIQMAQQMGVVSRPSDCE